jgi:hypothetical protein
MSRMGIIKTNAENKFWQACRYIGTLISAIGNAK